MPDFKEKVSYDNVYAAFGTEKSLGCVFKDLDDRTEFIPHSQIDDDSEVYEVDHEGTLVISLWIAEQKGLPV